MAENDVPRERIPEPELRELALRDAEECTSVILELDLPPARLKAKDDAKGHRRLEEIVETPEEEEIGRLAEAARALLAKERVGDPQFLERAGAFVATVSGAQLHRLARSPLFRRIRRNRRLR